MKCQFYDIFTDDFAQLEYSPIEKMWHAAKKIPILSHTAVFALKQVRNAKKSLTKNNLKKINTRKTFFHKQVILNLKKGDVVRVRSKQYIEKTLDENNQFQGVEFMETMWKYCGETHRVFKRLERILDPWEDRLRKCRDMVILEGLFCHGDPKHNLHCDRTCLYYWKEAWLEKVSS